MKNNMYFTFSTTFTKDKRAEMMTYECSDLQPHSSFKWHAKWIEFVVLLMTAAEKLLQAVAFMGTLRVKTGNKSSQW